MNVLNKKVLSLIAVLLMSTGCAVQHDKTEFGAIGLSYHSDIVENTDGSYYAEVEAALTRGRIGGAEGIVTKSAVEKCASLGKAMKVVKKETESHLLINGVARLTFRCH
ncbi:hypothetical protein J8L98_11950 [Pseudoalteromonas sp. MMG013]|uniref:hypothetical protein n=1 Tax=unclassified Pseudoalteromonas TaxID=194690 RepID=UPI001B390069|nr:MULTISPECIES: hypothetical protein [unclassified Pseudoalteromonas]MBQ4852594.1 hypothetical protein [Pseudoalteromonas sp. MMG012]MBQ4862401.1 hypothetical protein [Pseudoalteromonas sp. MMG013]